mgnify:FL=1
MQKIINNKLYDTDTAKLIKMVSEYTFSPKPNTADKEIHHSLYQKTNGEFFLLKEDYRTEYYSKWLYATPIITPLSEDEAKKWAEDNLDVTEYINAFGPVSE